MAEGRARARHGADLFGHLPVDRFSMGTPGLLTDASYGLANEQLDRVSRACAVLLCDHARINHTDRGSCVAAEAI
jgi:hypothetical protein